MSLEQPDRNPATSSQELGLRIHPAEFGLGAEIIDTEVFHRNAGNLLKTGIDLRTLIDELPHGENASTMVGQSSSGKSEIMAKASAVLGVPYIDAGLLFRGLATQAANNGYGGGEVNAGLADGLAHTVENMDVILGKGETEQAVVIDGVRYTYSAMGALDRSIISGISQNPKLYTATMERLVSETDGKLIIVGGRSLGRHLPNAIAKFYVEREGNGSMDENNPTWSLDSPAARSMITIVNPEGAVDDSASAVSLILARRVEARASADQQYSLSVRNISLVTGEPAKLQEVEAAIANADQISDDENHIATNVSPDFLQEMTSVISAKARNARVKFPASQDLLVESTGLFVPKLHELGLPPEVIEYMSKHYHEAIFRYAGGVDVLDAYSVTVAAVIDSSGNITTSLGVASGNLQAQGRGEQGFGWDAYFVPTGHSATYGEMGSEKFSISSRAKAVAQMFRKLR